MPPTIAQVVSTSPPAEAVAHRAVAPGGAPEGEGDRIDGADLASVAEMMGGEFDVRLVQERTGLDDAVAYPAGRDKVQNDGETVVGSRRNPAHW
ncbi:hypothetical protein [Streptomyces sp. NPDC003480]